MTLSLHSLRAPYNKSFISLFREVRVFFTDLVVLQNSDALPLPWKDAYNIDRERDGCKFAKWEKLQFTFQKVPLSCDNKEAHSSLQIQLTVSTIHEPYAFQKD